MRHSHQLQSIAQTVDTLLLHHAKRCHHTKCLCKFTWHGHPYPNNNSNSIKKKKIDAHFYMVKTADAVWPT